jgi:hypothetical protein
MRLQEIDIRDIPKITSEQISHFRYSISDLTIKYAAMQFSFSMFLFFSFLFPILIRRCDKTLSSLAAIEFVNQDDEVIKSPDIATIITSHREKKQIPIEQYANHSHLGVFVHFFSFIHYPLFSFFFMRFESILSESD